MLVTKVEISLCSASGVNMWSRSGVSLWSALGYSLLLWSRFSIRDHCQRT